MRVSETTTRVVLAVLGLAGLGIATYLTVVHYQGDLPVCLAGGHGCAQVQESEYAELVGVPVPVIGLAGYVTVLLAAALPGDPGRFLGLFAGFVGAAFSIYLTYLELFKIEAICQWCVASAVIMCLVLVTALVRAVRFGGSAGAAPDADLSSLKGAG
jgi:uncharacterized membrane protein